MFEPQFDEESDVELLVDEQNKPPSRLKHMQPSNQKYSLRSLARTKAELKEMLIKFT